MAESTDAMLARIDERTENMAKSIEALVATAANDREKLDKLKDRVTRQETLMTPMLAAASILFSVLASIFIDPFKGT